MTRVNEFRNEELKTHIRSAPCVSVGIGSMFESRSEKGEGDGAKVSHVKVLLFVKMR